MSSSPARVTIKIPMAKKAMGDHLIESTSLQKAQSLSLVSATLEIEYATQFFHRLCFTCIFSDESPYKEEGWHRKAIGCKMGSPPPYQTIHNVDEGERSIAIVPPALKPKEEFILRLYTWVYFNLCYP